MKSLSIREVNENVSRALQDARHEPVLVRHADQPAVWMVSAEQVARAAQHGVVGADVYRHVLEVVAINLFDRGVLTMGQATRLLGIPMGDFIDLCNRLEVPVMRESGRSVVEQVDSFERWLRSAETPESTSWIAGCSMTAQRRIYADASQLIGLARINRRESVRYEDTLRAAEEWPP